MKIERNINGQTVTVELTDDEIYAAYIERQHSYDLEDVRCVYEMRRENDLYPEMTEDELDRAAYCYRKAENNSEDWTYSAEYAIGEIILEREGD